MSENLSTAGGPSIGDLAGAGQIINSEVAKRSYDDALSPVLREVGHLSRDTLKAFRLFTAPLQLAAAYQDRFAGFCERVRARVPEEKQQEAPPEIAAPVMKAFATTSDNSPLMSMFEELMAKAIDKSEADKLSPQFPDVIKSLSPHQAKMIKSLAAGQHLTDVLMKQDEALIVQQLGVNYPLNEFGGLDHHLTMSQDLEKKNLVTLLRLPIDKDKHYPKIEIPAGVVLTQMVTRLSLYGKWFAAACVNPPAQQAPKKPQ